MRWKSFQILILDDDPREDRGRPMYVRWMHSVFDHELNKTHGYQCQVMEASDAAEFKLRVVEIEPPQHIDLAILDMKISRWEKKGEEWVEIDGSDSKLEQGSDVLKKFASHPAIKRLVVLTAYENQHPEVERIAQGALEYWIKLETDFNTFRQQLESIFDLPSRYDIMRFEDAFDKVNVDIGDVLERLDEKLVGKHPALLRVKAQICEAALSDIPVLITGETGTGKEVVAELIHYFSDRGFRKKIEKPYSLNCAEFVEEALLRAELFGSKKGAYTDAREDKKGKLQEAERSTLFLDEVGLASPRLQGLLLRAFEEKRACPVGGTEKDKYDFDVRFIAATDQDVFRSEQFSKAFLYRLSGMHIHLPPLRERKSDIPLLVKKFMADIAPAPRITFATWQVLEEYHWPGNVRQLKDIIKLLSDRCRLTGQKTITRHDVELLLPGAEKPEIEESAIDSRFDRYTNNSVEYDEVKSRFLADYIYYQHQRLSEGQRTNEAYANTARALNCSISTVKERLRDYQQFFGSE